MKIPEPAQTLKIYELLKENLVVSSVEKPSQNLQILAAVAQLIRRSPLLLKKISKARSSQEIRGIIREEEEKIF